MKTAPLYDDIAKAPPNGRAFWCDTSDGVRIRVGHWPRDAKTRSQGTILLFPGRTEYIEKYGRNTSDLTARGFDVLVIDWRGQGLADRPDAQRAVGHVGHFDEYQRDVAAMMELAGGLELARPFVLLGHSMGGCIGLRALHNGLDVNAACFSAPMWGIVISPPLRPLAWGLSWALHSSPLKLTLAPGTVRETYLLTDRFAGNLLTTDRDFWDYMLHQAKTHPDLTLGGPTLGWLYAALREMHALARMPAPDMPAVTWLGGNERIVEPGPIHDLMARWPKGALHLFDGLEHEVLMEGQPVRDRLYGSIEALAQGRPLSDG